MRTTQTHHPGPPSRCTPARGRARGAPRACRHHRQPGDSRGFARSTPKPSPRLVSRTGLTTVRSVNPAICHTGVICNSYGNPMQFRCAKTLRNNALTPDSPTAARARPSAPTARRSGSCATPFDPHQGAAAQTALSRPDAPAFRHPVFADCADPCGHRRRRRAGLWLYHRRAASGWRRSWWCCRCPDQCFAGQASELTGIKDAF